jgi:hypothetical protein
MAEGVVQILAAADGMADVVGMRFGFAEVAPPAGDAGFRVPLVETPEPFAGFRLEDVDQAGLAEKGGEGLGAGLRHPWPGRRARRRCPSSWIP